MFQIQLNERQKQYFSSSKVALEKLNEGYEVTDSEDGTIFTKPQLELLAKYDMSSNSTVMAAYSERKMSVGEVSA